MQKFFFIVLFFAQESLDALLATCGIAPVLARYERNSLEENLALFPGQVVQK